MNYWVVIYRFCIGVLVVLCIIGLTCVFLPKCYRIREMQRRRAELETQNRELETDARALRIKQERFQSDPSFVEQTARREGKVKPGETVFKFTNQQSGPLPQVPAP